MTVTSPRDCQKLILKGRDSADVRALIPAEWWVEAEAHLIKTKNETEEEAIFCQKTGLVKVRGRWEAPEGYICITADGPAEEYFPGLFRRPVGVRLENGRITAKMKDADGYGVRKVIVGVAPEPHKQRRSAGKATDKKRKTAHTFDKYGNPIYGDGAENI